MPILLESDCRRLRLKCLLEDDDLEYHKVPCAWTPGLLSTLERTNFDAVRRRWAELIPPSFAARVGATQNWFLCSDWSSHFPNKFALITCASECDAATWKLEDEGVNS
jgi:hypothetical protein